MKISVKKLSEEEIRKLNIESWPIWECDVRAFDWFYDDVEQCYFLKGTVIVKAEGSEVRIQKGDFVTFPKGLRCTWDVKEAVRKHYKFG